MESNRHRGAAELSVHTQPVSIHKMGPDPLILDEDQKSGVAGWFSYPFLLPSDSMMPRQETPGVKTDTPVARSAFSGSRSVENGDSNTNRTRWWLCLPLIS